MYEYFCHWSCQVGTKITVMQLDILLVKDKRRHPILNVIFEIIWSQVVWSVKLIPKNHCLNGRDIHNRSILLYSWRSKVICRCRNGLRGGTLLKTLAHLLFSIFNRKSIYLPVKAGKHDAYHGKHHGSPNMVSTLIMKQRHWDMWVRYIYL